MDEIALRRMLDDLVSGALTPDDAVFRLRRLPFADLGFARVDHHRMLRQNMPEAVYGQGKTPDQCVAIVGELLASGHPDHLSGTGDTQPQGAPPVILTRADGRQVAAVTAAHRGGTVTATGPATGTDAGRGELSVVTWHHREERPARTLVVTAGTSDLPVAREAVATLAALGYRPTLLPDCGVAGVHRLLASSDELMDAEGVIVVAGMEGALASLVGGVTAGPVVAVPTSTGYGSGFEGVTALLAMHASCASGVSVVGIDNGYGAACVLARMLR